MTEIEEYLLFAQSIKSGDLNETIEFLNRGYMVPEIMPSPLYTAALYGQYDLVNLMLERNENIDVKTGGQSYTPLMIASEKGHSKVVKLLLDKGADVDHASTDGLDALSLAEKKNNYDAIRVFEEHGLFPSAVSLVSMSRPGKAFEFITAGKITVVDKHGRSVLPEFFRHKNDELALALIEKGIDVNGIGLNGESSLHIAVLRKDLRLIRILLEHGARIDVNGLPYSDTPPLIMAINMNFIGGLRLLLASGADVNIKDPYGKTALYYAVVNRKKDMVRDLLSSGADLTFNYSDEVDDNVDIKQVAIDSSSIIQEMIEGSS